MRRSHLPLAVLAALSCVGSTDLCACPPATGLGTLYGTVTTGAALTPAPGVVVRAETATGLDCETAQYWGDVRNTRAITDGAGQYRLTFSSFAPAESACVRARAVVPNDSVVASPFRMRLMSDQPAGAHLVERRLDFRLP